MDKDMDNGLSVVIEIMDTVTYYETLLSKKGLK